METLEEAAGIDEDVKVVDETVPPPANNNDRNYGDFDGRFIGEFEDTFGDELEFDLEDDITNLAAGDI